MSQAELARGYRQLSQSIIRNSGKSHTENVNILRDLYGYEVITKSRKDQPPEIWIRRRARKKGVRAWEGMSVVDTLDAANANTSDRYSFVDDFINSKYGAHLVETQKYVSEDPVELARDALSHPQRWRGMNTLGNAMAFCPAFQLKELIQKEVIPEFLRVCPAGRVVVVKYNATIEAAMGALRGFYAYAQGFPFVNVDDFEGFNTLKNWQMIQAPMVGRAILDVLNYLWYPNIAGFTGGPPVGLDLLFVFDPPERYSLPSFPENWLSIPKIHASFGRERRNLEEIFGKPTGVAAEAAAHGRFLHSRIFSANEQAVLVAWAVRSMSRLLYELTDLANFTEENQPSAPIDPVFAFEHALTVDRLIRLTLRAMSLDEPSAAKTTVFEVADLYDSLSERFGNTPQGSTEFSRNSSILRMLPS